MIYLKLQQTRGLANHKRVERLYALERLQARAANQVRWRPTPLDARGRFTPTVL